MEMKHWIEMTGT